MVIEINKENFKKEVLESKTPVIIDFFAEWCGPCQMMRPVFEKLSNEYKGKLKFAKVNTDEDSELAGKYGIQSIPCLIVLNKGKEIERIVGAIPENRLKEAINDILKRN